MRHRERGEGTGKFAPLRHLLCLPDRHGVKVSTRKEKTQSLLQAWSKNAQVFHRSRLLKRLPVSNISAKMKKQGLFLLGVRASCLSSPYA